MKKIGAIHTFEDQAFLHGITRASLAVVVGGLLVAVVWGVALTALGHVTGVPVPPFELGAVLGRLGARLVGADPATARANPLWCVSLVLATVVAFAAHELVHGFFFRQYAPAGSRVTFGANLKMGMIYASAEGIVYTRQQYLVIAVAPSIVVTTLLVAVGIGLKWPLWTIIVATVHLSGCTGDWGYMRTILRDPSITHCEDMSWGVEFYGEGAPEATPLEVVGSPSSLAVPDGADALDARKVAAPFGDAPASASSDLRGGSVTAASPDLQVVPDEPVPSDPQEAATVLASPDQQAQSAAVTPAFPGQQVQTAPVTSAADKGFSVVDGGKSA